MRAAQQLVDLDGLWAADLAEQCERFLPARHGGVGVVGVPQNSAKRDQGVGLAETLAGVTEKGERLLGMCAGPFVLVEVKVDTGQGGEHTALQQPVAGLAG